MNKLSQSTLQQWYVQQTKPHLCLSTVQSTTKKHVYIFTPPHSIYAIYTYHLQFVWALVHQLCNSYSIQIATWDMGSCFANVNSAH